MALIPKTNIVAGNTIQPSDITNIIEALDGTGSYTIITTGSFTGSFTGNLTGTASYAANAGSSFPFTGSAIVTGSLTVTGSLNAPTITGSLQGSSSYALTASYALNGGSGGDSFPYTGSAIISSSLTVTGSMSISGSLTFRGPEAYTQVTNPLVFINTTGGKSNITAINGLTKEDNKPIITATDKLGGLDLSLLGSSNTSGFSKGLVLPVSQSLDPVLGSCYVDGNGKLQIYDGSSWIQVNP
jgi:hypothetical protein